MKTGFIMRESGDWKRGCICSARRRECGIFTGCTCLVSEILENKKINTIIIGYAGAEDDDIELLKSIFDKFI